MAISIDDAYCIKCGAHLDGLLEIASGDLTTMEEVYYQTHTVLCSACAAVNLIRFDGVVEVEVLEEEEGMFYG